MPPSATPTVTGATPDSPHPARHCAAVVLVLCAIVAAVVGVSSRAPDHRTASAHTNSADRWSAISAGQITDAAIDSTTNSLTSSGASSSRPAAPLRIDLNAATVAQLELLPGIGPSKAKAILDDRQRNGAFLTVDDLDRVPGIGPKTVDRLREHVSVTPSESISRSGRTHAGH